ncbi:hybrid sensor histidine kinase/response regulator [Siphonobacter sp. BAB-5405]|nr:hybrid sensor histidine kinase/response regulator [Siphonobacter sp. BAB-5405]
MIGHTKKEGLTPSTITKLFISQMMEEVNQPGKSMETGSLKAEKSSPVAIRPLVEDTASQQPMTEQSALWTRSDQLPYGLLIENEERKVVYINQSYCDIFEIKVAANELIGKTIDEIFETYLSRFNVDKTAVDQLREFVPRHQIVEHFTLPITEDKVIVIDFIPLVPEGSATWHVWKFQISNKNYLSPQNFKQIQENYWSIIEKMDLGILEVDTEERIVRAHDRFCRMVGYTSEELVGKPASELLLLEAYTDFINEQSKTRFEGKTSSYEIPLRCKDGRIIWVIVNGAPVYDAAGKVIGSVGIHYDNTERRKLIDDLALAKKAAEDAQLAEKQFLANMSHEIRTPLNAIIGMTHLLYDTQVNAEQKEYLEILQSSSRILQNLLTDILDISALENGTLPLQLKEFDIRGLLMALHRIYELQNNKKDVEIALDIDPNLATQVYGSERLIYQIVSKLLNNAYKFTERGKINLKAKQVQSTNETITIQFEIRDTGVGIDDDKLEVIFEKFKQLPNETGYKYQGAGLGLALVKHLIDLLGGSITVYTKKGEGTRFIFQLPFKKINFVKSEHQIPIVNTTQRILVVEDNLMNRKYVGGLLDKWNLPYKIVTDGQEAIRIIEHENFDLILMDIQMPFLDGYETTLMIRSTQNINQNIPIVALTASAMQEQKEQALKVGMTDFLAKPFTPKQLLEKISMYLSPSDTQEMEEQKWQYHPELDSVYLHELYGEEWTYAYEMFQTFRDEVLPEYAHLTPLVLQQNWESLAREAHKLNPPLAMVGLTGLQKYLKSIEVQLTHDNNPEGIPEKINFFQTELSRMAVILAEEVNRLAFKTAAQ